MLSIESHIGVGVFDRLEEGRLFVLRVVVSAPMPGRALGGSGVLRAMWETVGAGSGILFLVWSSRQCVDCSM